jgi:tRNA(Arg) A34 adenosine deaminase TadA
MKMALEEAKKGYKEDEIPVGCVFAKYVEGRLVRVAGSHNLTNVYKNASRHC